MDDDLRVPTSGGTAQPTPFDWSGLVRGDDGLLWFAGAPKTFTDQLRAVVSSVPSEVAVIDGDGSSLTYADLWERASATAAGFSARGRMRGARIAIDLPDSKEWVVAFVATLLAGGVAVPLDQRASQRKKEATASDAGALFVVDETPESRPGAPAVVDADAGDPALMLYTSGTSGEPKGVMISQRNLAALGPMVSRVLRLPGGRPPRTLIPIPLAHAAGCNALLLPTLAIGGTAIVASSPKAEVVVETALRFEPTYMMAVPAIYQLMVMRCLDDLKRVTSLQRITYGAAAMPPQLAGELQDALPGAELGNAFGMTEISGISLFMPSSLPQASLGAVGFPSPGVEIEIRDADANGRGELFLRGPNMARGYWQREVETEQVFGSGWVSSGDIASVDNDGCVFIHDRAKDVINRGGEKIYSLEVENAIASHPCVAEVAVVPVADLVMGEKVGAVVVLEAGASCDASHLTKAVAQALPGYAVPEHVVFHTGPLPRGTTGKVLKSELRDELGLR